MISGPRNLLAGTRQIVRGRANSASKQAGFHHGGPEEPRRFTEQKGAHNRAWAIIATPNGHGIMTLRPIARRKTALRQNPSREAPFFLLREPPWSFVSSVLKTCLLSDDRKIPLRPDRSDPPNKQESTQDRQNHDSPDGLP